MCSRCLKPKGLDVIEGGMGGNWNGVARSDKLC